MNPSRLFILRPVATSLLMVAIMLVGALAFQFLPLSALPEVDYPTIQIQTFYPGASPDVMTSSVTAPLERQLGEMPGLNQMTSTSSAGASVITLQFNLTLSLDIAEQEVQASINAAGNLLPSDLPAPPIYAKVNPADAPILTLALTSKTLPLPQVEDAADTRLAQKISQLPGVGLVSINGGQRPAVRIEADTRKLAAYGLNIDDLRTTIGNANVDTPKGNFDGPTRSYSINANDQLQSAGSYMDLVIAYKNGNPVRLSDVAKAVQSGENTRLGAWMNTTPAVILNIQRQPGANVIAVVDGIKALLPSLQEAMPATIDVTVLTDRTVTIRASVSDVEFELTLAVVLVVLVIFVFLRSTRATLIPSLSVPLSLIGTFGAMYILGFSLNNLSLMALTIASGFVVDDAIVMIENISRYIEEGEPPLEAALKGSAQIGFTIISLTVSLIAVLIPLLFMGDVVGRLFREFAITLSVTILISAVVSLTVVPMACAKLLKPHDEAAAKESRFQRWNRERFDDLIQGYGRWLAWVLDHQVLTLIVAVATLAVTALLYVVIPKGFFPVQDTGLIQGITEAAQTVSYGTMAQQQEALAEAILKDPDVVSLSSFIGVDGSNTTLNSGRVLINLKPKDSRSDDVTAVMLRLEQEVQDVAGISLYMQPVQDLTIDTTVSRNQYQFLLESADPVALAAWTPKLVDAMGNAPAIADSASDLEQNGLAAYITIDRATAGRFGITPATVDNALYDAFGQRIVSTIFTQSNQYRVIIENDPSLQTSVRDLTSIYLPSSGGGEVPLSVIATVQEQNMPLQVDHLGQFPSATVSFNLAPGYSLGEAVDAIQAAAQTIGMPQSIVLAFQGAALAFQSSLSNELFLILAALVTVYIVLGVLYESFVHPVTILSTLPSAGIGALLALILTGGELTVIAIIGIVLLIGIVKKNAIMMIDFALDAQRNEGKSAREAIYQASLLRFRPILMTTMAAILGALPLMLGTGTGSELRQPLGLAIVGGLIFSQMLTLFTTPVIYLTFDRLATRLGVRGRRRHRRGRRRGRAAVNLSEPFIRRPAATILLTIGVALAGAVAFFRLPVSPLPQVDMPTISVQAQMPGASPEVMATSVATPLERHLGIIADVTEMTSNSGNGTTRITLQFDLSRDIDGAARDVQAAINAARADLPANLRSNPTYRKVNSADAPILILALTSDSLSHGQVYDAATTVLEQKFSQIEGVGEVDVGGGSLPAVRVELNPKALFKYGIGLEDIRAALASANAHSPKGAVEEGKLHFQIYDNDQARQAADYQDLVVAYRNNAAVHLSDLGDVTDSVENIRNAGMANGKPSILVIIYRSPNANIIDTVDRVVATIPQIQASISPAIDITVGVDRSTTIRASLNDIERTLLIASCLVIMVVFLFLRNARATLVPAIAVPVSLIATFGVMYLLNFSIDNLSLMALTVATGFVVDDAIVVLENITRHIEAGMPRFQAALVGAREVGFTVLSMSLSLVAVFIPIILMGGIVGRFFREFGITLSAAVLVSLVVSLTTTPMMCARILRPPQEKKEGRFLGAIGHVFERLQSGYERSLRFALRHSFSVFLVFLGAIALNVFLYIDVPKGFFPQQDTGRLVGGIQADQSISFQLMQQKMTQFVSIVQKDPAVDSVVGFTGGGTTNSGFVFMSLKPLAERKISADQVIARMRGQLASVPGASLFLQAVQDFRVGGRQSNAQYQYTIQGDTLEDVYTWSPKILAALQQEPILKDVNSDQQQKGLESDLVIDRATASRLGITASMIDNTLYDAFGQRQVSTIYNPLNQYHVVMEVAPQYWQEPETLKDIFISAAGGAVGGVQSTNAVAGTFTGKGGTSTAATIAADSARNAATNAIAVSGHGSASTGSAVSAAAEKMVPLAAISSFQPGSTPLNVSHQGLSVASTLSFNLAPGKALSDAVAAVNDAMNRIGVPASIHGSFQGTARVFEQSLANEPYLIAAALAAVYIVLGVLYESYVHPLTILSTLPSAGVGAILALLLTNTEFTLIALIGVILLIGIVKKNAIMMIDFALDAQRTKGLDSHDAIFEACMLRFRPIMMTTMAALLGAVPLAFGYGEGGELRRPLGLSIVGGLIVSQALTLYTTPVIYLYLDRFRLWAQRQRGTAPLPGAASAD